MDAQVFLVSKVLPHNVTRRGTITACGRSLRRLRMDRLDLYLLHRRGRVHLEETLDALTALVRAGKIRHWGISSFDVFQGTRVPGGAFFDPTVLYHNCVLIRRFGTCPKAAGTP